MQQNVLFDEMAARVSILKVHKHSKMIKTHTYRLYSIMTGSKIIDGSHSKV